MDGDKVLTSGKGDMQHNIYTMYRLTGGGALDPTFGNAGALILPSPFETVTNGIT